MFVSDIIEDVIEVLGRCDRAQALKRISQAVQALQDEGDWSANTGVVDIRTLQDGNTIVLPHEIETPLAVAVAGSPAVMRDEFYRFHINGDGLSDSEVVSWAWDDEKFSPCFRDILVPGRLAASSSSPSDDGLLLRILGYDKNNRRLSSQQNDGSLVDGIFIAISPIDAPPSIEPSTILRTRFFSPQRVLTLSSATAHSLASGAEVQLSLVAGELPEPLSSGTYYFVYRSADNKVSIHRTRLNAETQQDPIEITSLSIDSQIQLTDTRNIYPETLFRTSGDSFLKSNNRIIISGASIPAPVVAGCVYFANPLTSTDFRIFSSEDEANEDRNPINATSAGSGLSIKALREMSPVTILNFPVRHNISTGDQITIENSGGEIPLPLLAGVGYYARSVTAFSMTLHTTAADAASGANPITLTTPGSGTNSVVKLIPASVSLGSASNVTTAQPHGLNSASGSGATATAATTANSVTSITVTNAGSGYEVSPIVTLSAPASGGTQAKARANVSGGIVTSIDIIAAGTNYTSVPTVTITPACGSIVRFVTNGSLPAPIAEGTAYRAESPIAANTFTLSDSIPEKINVTSYGTGDLFIAISRAFTLGFLPQFSVDFSNYSTGQAIQFYSNSILPTSSPQIDSSTTYYARKLTESIIEIYQSLVQAQNLASTTGRISALSFSGEQLYMAISRSITTSVYGSDLAVDRSANFLEYSDAVFTTTGTLPAPLSTASAYKVSMVDGKAKIFTSGLSPVAITGIGSGIHSLVVQSSFTPDFATSISVPKHQTLVGESVEFTSTEALPSPLQAAAAYFIRPTSFDDLEIYSSQAQAEDLNSTAGRITLLSSGSGTLLMLQEDGAPEISKIEAIEKPETSGFVRLFCWNPEQIPPGAVTLGEFQPKERIPSYRRVKVASNTTWVRMKYRRRSIDLQNERDFINLDSRMAIILMVQSHELLLRKFADEAERYRKLSVEHLNKRNRALDGPRAPSIQINADIMGNPDDMML